MDIKKIVTGSLRNNCYILWNKKNECVIIDPGSEFYKIRKYIDTNNLIPIFVVLTHGHYDHIGTLSELTVVYKKVKIYIGDKDKECLTNPNKSLASLYANYKQFPVLHDVSIFDEMEFGIEDINIKCIHTPGHSPGSFCFLVNESILFTGDTLFKESIGRTDFPHGNKYSLIKSIEKIYSLLNPSEENPITIYPGHGLSSNLFRERKVNKSIISIINIMDK